MEFLAGQNLIKVFQGVTSRTTRNLANAAGTPINVTSYTWAANIRQLKSEQKAALGAFTVNVPDAVNGVIELYLTAAQTTTLWMNFSALYSQSAGFLYLYYDVLGTAPAAGDTFQFDSGIIQLCASASHT